MSLETEKRDLNCYAISNLLYDSDCWRISIKMKRLEAMDVALMTNTKNIPGREHLKNKEDLRKMGTTRKLRITIRKRQPKFMRHIMREEGLGSLTLRGYTDS